MGREGMGERWWIGMEGREGGGRGEGGVEDGGFESNLFVE